MNAIFPHRRKVTAVAVLIPALGAAGLAIARPSPLPAPLRQNTADDATVRQGRAVAGLIAKKDAAALFALFDAKMAAALPQAQVEGVLNQVITADTPLGARVSDEISDLNGVPAYVAEHRWAPGKLLQLTVVFSSASPGKISGLFVKPVDGPAPAALSSTAKAGVLAAGRAVAVLIARKDAAALFARFLPDMANAVPKAQLAELLNSTFTADAPLGGAISETAEAGPKDGIAAFTGKYRWKKDQPITLKVMFVMGSGGKIAGMMLKPDAPKTLPADPHAGYRMKTPLGLPFTPGEKWTVVWGGDTVAQNYHVNYADQRHAYDILIVRDGKTHDGDGDHLKQFYAYGRPILAPAGGEVIEAVTTLPDNAPGKMDPAHPAGNHILLDMGNNEYLLLAHMQPGSVTVKRGERVERGQTVGLCGNSGNTSEPHLHIHVQDKPYLFRDALGLPAIFDGYVSDGREVTNGSPVQGEIISAEQPPVREASK